jgi:PBP1b-binding outer membrane lipoprotein LpoB
MRYQHIFLLIAATVMFTACSGDNNDQESATEKMTREVAEKAVKHIQDPIDKARDAAALAEKHTEQIKKNMEQSDL